MNGVFAIEKPSGITSARLLDTLQNIFTKSDVFQRDLTMAKSKMAEDLSSDKKWSKERIQKRVQKLKVKIGHGGTLDPLATGVLVVGVGAGTKKLQYYLAQCKKTYAAKALLGLCTTTGDSEGEIVSQNEIDHITKEDVKNAAARFVGDVKQTPSIYSALKVDGMPLYDYARKGLPIPKDIKVRDVTIHSLEVFDKDLLSTDHEYKKLESQFDENGEPKEHALMNNPTLNDSPVYFSSQYLERAEREGLPKEVGKPRMLKEDSELPEKLPMFSFEADVSSGTYIRSLISDIGRTLESSAYMVALARTKQSEWELGKNVFKMEDFSKDQRIWGPVLKKVLESNGADIELEKLFEDVETKLAPLFEKEKQLLSDAELRNQEELQNEADSTKDEALQAEQKDKQGQTESNHNTKKRSIDEVEN